MNGGGVRGKRTQTFTHNSNNSNIDDLKGFMTPDDAPLTTDSVSLTALSDDPLDEVFGVSYVLTRGPHGAPLLPRVDLV